MRIHPLFLAPLLTLAACRTAVPAAEPVPGPRPATPSPHGPPFSAERTAVEGRDFVVVREDGTASSLRALVDRMPDVRVVLVGEEHDDVAGHRVELELLQRAWMRHHQEGGRPVVLSLEMFERDVQEIVDEYLAGLITEEHFLASARPWANYVRDYRPLVEFARAHGVPVVAANAPRRYVNRASRLGRDSLGALPDAALEWLAPLPYPEASDRYRAQWDSLMGGAAAAHMAGHALDAQTLWDATMAWSITRALDARPGALVIHVAGGFHVEKGTGIVEALRRYRPELGVLSVALVPVEDPREADTARAEGLADWVVLTDADWKTSLPPSHPPVGG